MASKNAANGALNGTHQLDPNSETFPSLNKLPKIDGNPSDSAWLWGADDELGRLNLLTPTRVLAATKLISSGLTIPLNLPLELPSPPCFHRQGLQHEYRSLMANKLAWDDTITINTQAGTQWDGFRHMAALEEKVFYNNLKPEDIESGTKCGIHAAAQKGLVFKTLVVDWGTYAAAHENFQHDSSIAQPITLSSLHACIRSQGINPLPVSQGGDIPPGCLLLISSGFLPYFLSLPPSSRTNFSARHAMEGLWVGLEQGRDVEEWLHDCWFSAVAGDMPSFEIWPKQKEGRWLHECLLALWGVLIGEFWKTETLVEMCRERERWWCCVVSQPCDVGGGVASPPNVMAIL